MRWIVCASWPVASSSRRAARPVGAQRAIVRRPRSASATIACVQTVLPTPGPPVSTEIRDAKAPRTAAHCSSVSASSSRLGRRLAGVVVEVGGRGARRPASSATASSLAWVGSR